MTEIKPSSILLKAAEDLTSIAEDLENVIHNLYDKDCQVCELAAALLEDVHDTINNRRSFVEKMVEAAKILEGR